MISLTKVFSDFTLLFTLCFDLTLRNTAFQTTLTTLNERLQGFFRQSIISWRHAKCEFPNTGKFLVFFQTISFSKKSLKKLTANKSKFVELTVVKKPIFTKL